MSETKFEGKSGAHSEKISLASEIFARLAKFASLVKITVAAKFFFLFLDFFFK